MKHTKIENVAINLHMFIPRVNKDFPTLAGVAQWIEQWPVNQRVAGLIPSQGTCLGYRSGPQ